MAARKKPRQTLVQRTPVAEWTAAGLGLLLTLAVLGYSVWQGLTDTRGPPSLSVAVERAAPTAGGFVVPLTVRNTSDATAADVEVRGVLEQAGVAVEERRAGFAYVPGRGEVSGGLVFQNDPARYRLSVRAEGYEEP